jgi:hypothetical protein
MAAMCCVRAGRFERAREIAATAAREGAGLGPHRRLHAVASRAIALVPSGCLDELLDATEAVEELIERERDHICANALVALAARTLALHERGDRAGAAAACALFDDVAPVSKPLVRWGPWIVEALRDVTGIAESLERLRRVEVRRGSGNAVDVLRAELLLRALAADWERVGELAETTRGLASTTCAPALSHVVDWTDAMRLVAEGRTAQALEVGGAATTALAKHGERYNAARLMADLLARLGDEAPPSLKKATAARLDAMGAHASAAASRTPDGGA